jgi:phosphatidylglycerol:prolipoprotein diacylglycerol transferase
MNNGVAFMMGPIAVPWYGILLTVGAIIAAIFAYFRWRKNGYSNYQWWLLVIPGIIIAVFGARWWYLMFNPEDYNSFIDLFSINRGRAIQGTIFFSTLWMFIYSTWIFPNTEFRKVASIILPSLLLAQAIGRWGNFYNGEIYGAPTDSLWWLPTFIQDGMTNQDTGQMYEPLFLYESIVNIIGWFLIFFVMNSIKWFKPGTQAAAYFIWYDVTSAIMEPMRASEFQMHIGGLSTSFWIAIAFSIFGFFMFVYYQWFYSITHEKINKNYYTNIKYIKINFRLKYLLITNQISKQNYSTIISVSKNKGR